MIGPHVVLDCEGLSVLAEGPSDRRRALNAKLRRIWQRGGQVWVPAVVCAEVCRTSPRTRSVESLLERHKPDGTAGIQVVNTDFVLAKEVGSILGRAGLGSSHIVDAHVVVTCVRIGGAIVMTSDKGDIRTLADHVPSVRIITHRC